MVKYFLISILLLLVTVILFSESISSAVRSNIQERKKYEHMVNASVSLLDSSGGYSGVFIDDNVILTAGHCLEGETTFSIELRDGTILESNDFYIDEKEDIGFIFVDANEISIAKVSLLPMHIGDTVYLVSVPFYNLFAFSLTKGIVSYIGRDDPDWGWEDLLQVDANGGAGSSGGPLYDSKGNLVGIYVGHVGNGGRGISLCEDAKSILEAYQRCKDAQN